MRFSKKILYNWYSLSVSSYFEISDLIDIMFALIFFISATFSSLALVSVSALKKRILKNNHMPLTFYMKFASGNHGPVVQSIVSLTTLLRRHFVKYMPTTLSNPLLFFVEKM